MAALDLDHDILPAFAPGAALWALLGNRRGDNAMIEAVAEASGLDCRSIQLRFNPLGALQNTLSGGSLFSLTGASRAMLAPPWPAVVLTSGKRAVPAALWIRRASGGRTRLVHIGRPQAPLDWFDLVVTTPQYRLPRRPNVMVCRLPATARSRRCSVPADLAQLPRPHLVALVGGSAKPQILDAGAARDFAKEALAQLRASGGSLLVATSPRTSRAAVEALRRMLADGGPTVRLCIFGEGANRYRDFLASADCFLVTDDSVSMVVETAATGRPIQLFRLPSRPGPLLRAYGAIEAAASRNRAGRTMSETLVARGLIRSNRDIAGYISDFESDGLLTGGDTVARLARTELADVAAQVRMLATAESVLVSRPS